MASTTLYPPLVDAYQPPFYIMPIEKFDDPRETPNSCSIIFSLARYNTEEDFKSIHISVTDAVTGMSLLKTDNYTYRNQRHWRETGILLLETVNPETTPIIRKIGDNLYSVNLDHVDLSPISAMGHYEQDQPEPNSISEEDENENHYEGFIPGQTIKIQIRLSSVNYSDPNGDGLAVSKPQAIWLKDHANDFSEWSTVITTKPIGNVIIDMFSIKTYATYISASSFSSIGLLNYNYPSDTIEIKGRMRNDLDPEEYLYKCRYELAEGHTSSKILLEKTPDFIMKSNSFNYTFKRELENNKNYTVTIYYTTANGYEGRGEIYLTTDYTLVEDDHFYIATLENYEEDSIMKRYSSLGLEEDEGLISYKIVDARAQAEPFSGKIYIRRTSSLSNFKIWEDIKELTLLNQSLNELPVFYDFITESGVWYLYGIQKEVPGTPSGEIPVINRSALSFPLDDNQHFKKNPSIRDFEYSFLLGENNQQLKLKFDNTMNNYKIQQMENKTETIGNLYPFISRNAILNYRIIPVNGLISFEADDNKLFCGEQDIYKFSEICNLYRNYENNKAPGKYNYIYEREFRKKVMEFLTNGKPKLFKSPTEGNIIVRLTDINFTPNQTLSRLVYSFTANGNEIAECNIDNYIKYKFLNKSDISEHGLTPAADGHTHPSSAGEHGHDTPILS